MAPGLDLVGQVLDTLGHDLRGPLFTARGYMQLVEARVEDERLKQMAQEAIGSLDEAARMVEGVLAWARTEPHRLSVGDVPLEEVLEQICTNVPEASERVQISGLPVVQGDKRALRYALQHLVENALVYSPPQSTVSVEGGRQGGSWWVHVIDRGPGLEADETLLVPFWEAARRSHGAGIAIANKVAKAHGGSLQFLPRPEGGTVARLEGTDG